MDWIIPGNLKYFDIIGAFNKLQNINWKQSSNVNAGDMVYIYVGNPISAIKFKCIALKVNLDKVSIDDSEFVIHGEAYENYGRYMELQLLEKYENQKLSLEILKDHGLRSVQGPCRVTEELSKYINSNTETDNNKKEELKNK